MLPIPLNILQGGGKSFSYADLFNMIPFLKNGQFEKKKSFKIYTDDALASQMPNEIKI